MTRPFEEFAAEEKAEWDDDTRAVYEAAVLDFDREPSDETWEMLDRYMVRGRVPSDAEREIAARIRVDIDRRQGRKTPQWIKDIAGFVPEWRSPWRRFRDWLER